MLNNGEYNALAEPVLHHPHRPVNQSDECDLDATLRLVRLLPVGERGQCGRPFVGDVHNLKATKVAKVMESGATSTGSVQAFRAPGATFCLLDPDDEKERADPSTFDRL
jgi:hypothetical protein